MNWHTIFEDPNFIKALMVIIALALVLFIIYEVIAKILNKEGLIVRYLRNKFDSNFDQCESIKHLSSHFFQSEYRRLDNENKFITYLLIKLNNIGFVVKW